METSDEELRDLVDALAGLTRQLDAALQERGIARIDTGDPRIDAIRAMRRLGIFTDYDLARELRCDRDTARDHRRRALAAEQVARAATSRPQRWRWVADWPAHAVHLLNRQDTASLTLPGDEITA